MDPEARDRTLYVGNLDRRVSEYHLMQLFSQFGELIRVQFMWHHFGELKGQPRGFAFVEFDKKEEAEAAVAQANGIELAGRKMNIRFAEMDKDSNEGGAAGTLNVDFKSTADRRSAAVGARVSAYQGDRGGGDGGGRGGGRGGFRGGGRGGGRGGSSGGGGRDNYVPFDKFAYVAAPIPSAGFGRHIDTTSRATTSSGVLLAALDKIRAIEDKLEAIQAEQNLERREAAKKMLNTDHSSAASGARRQQPQQQQQPQTTQRRDAPPNNVGLHRPSSPSRTSTGDQRADRSGGGRSGFVHPDRRRNSRSRSRERRA